MPKIGHIAKSGSRIQILDMTKLKEIYNFSWGKGILRPFLVGALLHISLHKKACYNKDEPYVLNYKAKVMALFDYKDI